MSIKDKAKKFFDSLTPEKKRFVVLALITLSLTVLIMTTYLNRSKITIPSNSKASEKRVEMTLEPGLLEKSQYREQEKALHERDEQMKKLQQEVEDIKKVKEKETNKSPQAASGKYPNTPLPPIPSPLVNAPKEFASNAGSSAGNAREGEIPTPVYSVPPMPLPSNSGREARSPGAASPAFIGDIEIISNPGQKPVQANDAVKKKAEKIYLPPSYMEASLLSGLDAPTVESAKGNPVPVLIRIKNLAQLPNRVKADLKGCFAIADGIGNLADERAHLRLLSITCLSRGGSAVIDQKVKGFVVDQDGKIGLAGKVVAKMGAMLARGLLSGFFGGIGDGLKAASQVNLVSPLGTTTSINSGDLLKSAVGGGMAEASHDLQKFYLKLAEATLPVIEIGAARDITLVISEGVDLEIKSFCGRNNTLEGKCASE
jgi:conjugal transfer pilus assembly protein TraB